MYIILFILEYRFEGLTFIFSYFYRLFFLNILFIYLFFGIKSWFNQKTPSMIWSLKNRHLRYFIKKPFNFINVFCKRKWIVFYKSILNFRWKTSEKSCKVFIINFAFKNKLKVSAVYRKKFGVCLVTNLSR